MAGRARLAIVTTMARADEPIRAASLAALRAAFDEEGLVPCVAEDERGERGAEASPSSFA